MDFGSVGWIHPVSAHEIEQRLMCNETPLDRDGGRRRLDGANLTPEQRAAVEARRTQRKSSEYQDELAWDIDAYREDIPPVDDPDLIETLAGARGGRARQRLSPTAMAVRTGIDRATISELETGKIADPTISASTWIRPMSRPTFVAVISIILIPVIFLSITSAWNFIDAFLGSREVSRYIKDHQSVVTQRLNDPKVHSFTLEHDPSQWAALLIEFDVDDKAT
jgi:transcriptional regulator with XRE-family HTH domain